MLVGIAVDRLVRAAVILHVRLSIAENVGEPDRDVVGSDSVLADARHGHLAGTGIGQRCG